MLLIDSYVHFLTSFKDTSILGWVKRWYKYKTFPKVSVKELAEIYQWNLYRMLNDFVYLYSRLDLFFKLSTYDEFREETKLDMKRVDIESEVYLLKDYTVYYTLLFKSNHLYTTGLKLSWNDKDHEVEGYNWATNRTWTPDSIHTGLTLDVADNIIGFMNHLLDRFWNVPEKNINYESVHVLSMNIVHLNVVQSSLNIEKDFYIDLESNCQYMHIDDHRYQELVPILVQINKDDKLYLANVKLAVIYINYRFEYLKTTYNPYVIDYLEQHQDQIVQAIRNIVTAFDEIV